MSHSLTVNHSQLNSIGLEFIDATIPFRALSGVSAGSVPDVEGDRDHRGTHRATDHRGGEYCAAASGVTKRDYTEPFSSWSQSGAGASFLVWEENADVVPPGAVVALAGEVDDVSAEQERHVLYLEHAARRGQVTGTVQAQRGGCLADLPAPS